MQDTLFDLSEFRSEKKGCAEKVEREEKPFRQPVWRDASGKFHYAEFLLIYRSFALTRLHDHYLRYIGQHDVPFHPWIDSPGDHFDNRLESFLRGGWPTPTPGGAIELVEQRGTLEIHQVTIFATIYLYARGAHAITLTGGLLISIARGFSVETLASTTKCFRRRSRPGATFRSSSCVSVNDRDVLKIASG